MMERTPSPTLTLAPLEEAVRRTARRLRVQRALAASSRALGPSLVLAVVVLSCRKTLRVGELPARLALLALALGVVSAGLLRFARAVSRHQAAQVLDRHHGLDDRLASAIGFLELGPSRTPFMELAIEDAAQHAAHADPAVAAPYHAPPGLGPAAVLAVVLVVMGLFEVRHHERIPLAEAIDAVDVSDDDLDATRESLRDLAPKLTHEDAKVALAEFNQLVLDLAAKRLDRPEAFRRMQALDDRLQNGREVDPKALEDALRAVGDALKKADETRPVGEALDAKNLSEAEARLRALAKRLRSGVKVDPAQLERLREALKKAATQSHERTASLRARRDELKKQLLDAKSNDGGADDAQRSLLQKHERELERLDREQEQAARAERELERLDRELAQAAEDLMKDLGLSANDLERGAEDINRMGQDAMSDEEKAQLRQKLQELRENVRQQGAGGGGQTARLRRFQQAARGGQGGQGGAGPSGGASGEGSEQGEGNQAGQGQAGQGGQASQGDGQGPGAGGSGAGEAGGQPGGPGGSQAGGPGGSPGNKASGELWVLGGGGQKMLMLSQRARGAGGGGGRGSGPQGPRGNGAGTGHDAHVQGAATSAGAATQDTQVAGQDTGQGASRSQVIETAAERGFASGGYQRVYREYQTVAEEALEKDQIPSGYRSYVRRYFQLIRPRGTAPSETTRGPAP